MPTVSAAPERAGENFPAPSAPAGSRTPPIDIILAAVISVALVALAFLTSSSVDQTVTAPGTWTEVAVTLLGAGACGASILLGAPGRAWGAATVALFAAFAGFAALSILWSVQPDWAWFGANQLLAYLAVFAGAVALARICPERWPVLVGGVAAALVALSGYSLLAKVFPATLAPNNTYGRLQAPFGYWNTIGVAAAMGLPACLWSAARPRSSRLLHVLAVPGLAVLISVVVLSYSRSAALAAVLGVAFWVAFVPLRLRAIAVLALGAVAAAPIIAWALARPALTSDGIPLGAQDSAGHTFGWVLLIALVAATGIGVAAAVASDRVAMSPLIRRRIGVVLLALLALVPVLIISALAASSRGLTGEVSHAWTTLTSANSAVSDTSTRITQLGSSRPLYWHQGLQVGAHALLKGVGELGYGLARLRYTNSPAKSDEAHSYVVQTFADLGLVGIALTLALLIAWMKASARALCPRLPWRTLSETQIREREGLMALAGIVIAFGVQSTLDWTWYFEGVAIPALMCAGWLAGRGPLTEPVGRRRLRFQVLDRPGAAAACTLITAVALAGAWVIWQPLRSAQAMTDAENASSNAVAFADARTATQADPLSVQPLFQLAALDAAAGNRAAARRDLAHATQRQPDNPETWERLAQFDLDSGDLQPALRAAARVIALDHTADPNTAAANTIIAAAGHALAASQHHRHARARRSRRHRGGPPAARTSG